MQSKKRSNTTAGGMNIADEQIKESIKQAVNQIPGIIAEQITFKKNMSQNDPEIQNQKMLRHYHIQRQKKTLLWFGVICLSAVIFLMWAWNTKIYFYLFQNNLEKNNIWSDSKEDLQKILINLEETNDIQKIIDNSTKKNERELQTNSAIVESINTILNGISTSTAPTSSVINNNAINTTTKN